MKSSVGHDQIYELITKTDRLRTETKCLNHEDEWKIFSIMKALAFFSPLSLVGTSGWWVHFLYMSTIITSL